jgi:FtsH-binding integral membrane protein
MSFCAVRAGGGARVHPEVKIGAGPVNGPASPSYARQEPYRRPKSMTSMVAEVTGRVESRFLARVLLSTGAGLLLSLVVGLTGLLTAMLVDVAWAHSTVPYFVVAVATLLMLYDLAWARRIERLASDETSRPAVWGVLALLVGLVEVLLLLLDELGRLLSGMLMGYHGG